MTFYEWLSPPKKECIYNTFSPFIIAQNLATVEISSVKQQVTLFVISEIFVLADDAKYGVWRSCDIMNSSLSLICLMNDIPHASCGFNQNKDKCKIFFNCYALPARWVKMSYIFMKSIMKKNWKKAMLDHEVQILF